LTAANDLNDPFDFRPAYSESSVKEINAFQKKFGRQQPSREVISSQRGGFVSRGEYRAMKKPIRGPISYAKFETKLVAQLVSDIPRKGKVACFSEVGDSLLMWAHYAGDHTGICIRFALDFEKFEKENSVGPLKVEYVEDRPIITTLDLLSFASKNARDAGAGQGTVDTMQMMYLRKGLDWSYEREWRAFASDDDPPRYRFMHCLKPDALILGMKANSQITKRIVSEYGGVLQIFRASPSKVRFALDLIPEA
jgi:hypothetical protein